MIDLPTFVLLVFACARIARLVAQDSLWEGTRDKIVRWAETGTPWQQKVGILVACPYCVGVWAALALVAVVGSSDSVVDYLISTLAVAGGQSFIVSLSDDGD